MPYIKKQDRLEVCAGRLPQTPGELNFQIFNYVKAKTEQNLIPKRSDIVRFVDDYLGNKPNYQKFNDISGCLIRCHRELERRLGIKNKILLSILQSYDEQIAIYEDQKIEENGDV